MAAAGSALHGGLYLAGEGINLLRQIQNMRGSNPGFGKYSGPTSGYNNKKPDDLNIELGLQNRKTIDELYSTNDFDRTSNLLGAPQELRGTNKYIYAIDETGEIWISRAGATHHADLVGGKNVYGAGEMYIDRSGQIRLINDGSGHYLPQGSEFFPYLKSLLNSKGIDANQTILDNYGG
ncbi:MAG: hypothetical protein GY943_04315 [Chloroflexi bacterium]|nr:hypothetical protein [Chloroflexota bacterium]